MRTLITLALAFALYPFGPSAIAQNQPSLCEIKRDLILMTGRMLDTGSTPENVRQTLISDQKNDSLVQLISAIVSLVTLERSTKSTQKIADEFLLACTSQTAKAPAGTEGSGSLPADFRRCAAISAFYKTSPNASSIPSSVSQSLDRRSMAWLYVVELADADSAKKSVTSQMDSVGRMNSAALTSLASRCNAVSIFQALNLPSAQRGFPSDPRRHAEACIAVLSTAKDMSRDWSPSGPFQKSMERAHRVMKILTVEGIGEEGGTETFYWLSERNGGRMANVQLPDIEYCGKYYLVGVRLRQ